ncbi:MAG: phosphatidylglycerophosphatase A [Candidatus Binataceae bacterium]|jgi:phosphatidylglycerophosphatase A
MRMLIIFCATGAFTGYAPVAPGTFGSIVGLLVGLLLFAPLARQSPAAAVIIFLLLFIAACWIAGRAERIFAQHDSSRIVIDEILGMLAAMFLIPAGWLWASAAFGLFRLFDIWKPFPASWIDRRIRGGTGVMLDDFAAAIYANLILQAARRII